MTPSDPILYWNDVALDANKESFTNGAKEQDGPTLSSRALALVHLAMHDAYFAINTPTVINGVNIIPYQTPPTPIPAVGATNSAIAAAAYDMLARLYPTQKPALQSKLADAPASTGADASAGQMFGIAVSNALWKLRKDDDKADDAGYSPSPGKFKHRPDPDNSPQPFHGCYYGTTPLLAVNGTPPTLDPPPLSPTDYQPALMQVHSEGIKPELTDTLSTATSRRSPKETLIGIFWGYDGAKGLGTPPRLYNQIIRKIAETKEALNPNPTAKYARLLALVNVAMADAGILAWKEKYKWDVWRPVVAIREHDSSMGPLSATPANALVKGCDPFWLPLGAPKSNEPGKKNFTPPFPAYPSGHATFGAAAFQMTRLFYQQGTGTTDTLCQGLSFVSDELNGKTADNTGAIRPKHARTFDSLWDAIRENGISRVYLGVHWIFDAFGKPDYSDMVGGIPLGLKIAKNVYDNNLTKP